MKISDNIFRAYDIRGTYPEELNEKNISSIAKALGTIFHKEGIKKVVVGFDDRPSSLTLVNKFMNGFLNTGIDVINTGITVQPAIHYYTFMDGVDAGINVTASHNPGKFNGIKIDLKNAVPFYGRKLKELQRLAESGSFVKGKGSYIEEDLSPHYIKFIASKFKLKNKMRVVVYCGNGATSHIYPKVLEQIGADVVPLRCYLDSDFPAGMPNPESGNFYKELRAEVLETRAMLGVGFDGDGDRVGEVDEKGSSYKADEIFLLYVKDVLTRNPGATIAYDVKCSEIVPEYIKKLNGKPKMLRTGRSYFLEEMYSDKVMLACELSGHVYFKDDFPGFDDGIYAACRLLKIMDDTGTKLSRLMDEFPKRTSTPELKIDCPDGKKFEIVNKVSNDIANLKNNWKIDKTDGVRVKVSDTSWFLVRASNTSPYLSIRVEGQDKQEVEDMVKMVGEMVYKYL
jgi:phosphomannomutase / phosphoglucomutase